MHCITVWSTVCMYDLPSLAKQGTVNTLSVCFSSVSSACHALLARFLEKNFSDQLLTHHLGSEDDSQSKTCVLNDVLTHTFDKYRKQVFCVIIIIACNDTCKSLICMKIGLTGKLREETLISVHTAPESLKSFKGNYVANYSPQETWEMENVSSRSGESLTWGVTTLLY